MKELLKLSLEDPKIFVAILDAISTIIDEAVFTASEEGLTLRSLDSARSAMVDVKLPKQFFTEYEVSGQVNIGVRVKDLIKISKLGKRGTTQFQLEVPEGSNIIKLTFIAKSSMRTFELPLLDLTFEQIPVPKVKYEATLKIVTDELYDAVKAVSTFSDNVEFKATKDKFVISSGSEKGRGVSEYSRDQLIDLSVEAEEVVSAYSSNYLLDMVAYSELSEVLEVSFASRKPAKFYYSLINGGELTFYVAPRSEV